MVNVLLPFALFARYFGGALQIISVEGYGVLISAQNIWCAHVSLHMHSRMAVPFLFEYLVCVCVLVLVLVSSSFAFQTSLPVVFGWKACIILTPFFSTVQNYTHISACSRGRCFTSFADIQSMRILNNLSMFPWGFKCIFLFELSQSRLLLDLEKCIISSDCSRFLLCRHLVPTPSLLWWQKQGDGTELAILLKGRGSTGGGGGDKFKRRGVTAWEKGRDNGTGAWILKQITSA